MRPSIRLAGLLLLAPACADKGTGDPLLEGAPQPELSIFPSMELVGDDGTLDLESVTWPAAEGDLKTAAEPERFTSRTGFSPVQTAVVDLGIAFDASTLPSPEESLEAGAAVQLWDRTAGERLPALVELDAWPDNDEAPVLLVRPMVPVPDGHEVAVVLTRTLHTEAGDPMEPVGWWWDAVAHACGWQSAAWHQ